MSRLFLDTEFNGFQGELISMALVSAEGYEWYRTVRFVEKPDPWVADNVLPWLGKVTEMTTRHCDAHGELGKSLQAFLSSYRDCEIIADWPADFEHFASLLTGIGADGGFKEAFPCTMRLINVPGQLKPEVPHNALSDARALRDWWLAAEQDQRHRTLGIKY